MLGRASPITRNDAPLLSLLVTETLVSSSFAAFWSYITISAYLLERSYLQVVLVESIPATSYAISRVWGTLSDYYRTRKLFMVVGLLLTSIGFLALGIAREMLGFVVVTVLLSLFLAMVYPCLYVAAGERGGTSSYGLLQIAGNVGWIVGPTVAGIVGRVLDTKGAYLIASFMALVASAVILVFYQDVQEETEVSGRVLDALRSSLSPRLRARSGFSKFLVAVLLSWSVLYTAGALLKVKLYSLTGGSLVNYGLVIGIGTGTIGMLASIAATYLLSRFRGYYLAMGATTAYPVLLLYLALTNDPTLFIIGFMTPLWPLLWAGQLATTLELSWKGFEGENMGTLVTLSGLSALCSIAMAPIFDLTGLSGGIALTGCLMVLPALVLLTLRGSPEKESKRTTEFIYTAAGPNHGESCDEGVSYRKVNRPEAGVDWGNK